MKVFLFQRIFCNDFAFDDPLSCIKSFFHFVLPCQVIDQFKNSMAKIHPHRYKEPGPYVEIFERVISDLWKIYEHVLKESEWCLVLPGLFDQRDKFLVPVKAMPARPGQGGPLFLSGAGRGQGGSSFLSGAGRGQGGSLFPPGADAGQGGSLFPPGADAGQGGSLFPPGADAGQGGSSFQQKEPQKRAAPDYASAPPSSSSSEKIQKVLPPPPPKGKEPSIPIGGKNSAYWSKNAHKRSLG